MKKDPIISKNIRLRHPDHFRVGDFSIIDDFSYFSTRVEIGRCSHIASNCTIGGGVERLFKLGDFSSISAGCRIWCVSDDFSEDLVTVIPSGLKDVKKHLHTGDVIFQNYTACGANSVVLPHNIIPEGTVIGALSLVPTQFQFEPWSVYAGNPIRLIKRRNKSQVLSEVEALETQLTSQ